MGAGAIAAGTMRFEISHRTTYSYRRPVAQSHHLVHLQPRVLARQSVIHHSLLIDPAPVKRTDVTDYFGNQTVLLRIEDEHTEFIVHARSTVEITQAPALDLAKSSPWEDVAAMTSRPGAEIDCAIVQFACPSRHTPVSRDILKFAQISFPARRPVLSGAMDLTGRIYREFAFDPAATDISTPVARVLAQKRGVCQDFAHLSLAALRSLRIPARYVSGYLLTKPPPGQAKLKGTDASHAWLSVYAPQTGWVDFDPTNGIIPAGEHITVAFGRDYEDISPVSGVLLGGGDQIMTIAVDVEPVG